MSYIKNQLRTTSRTCDTTNVYTWCPIVNGWASIGYDTYCYDAPHNISTTAGDVTLVLTDVIDEKQAMVEINTVCETSKTLTISMLCSPSDSQSNVYGEVAVTDNGGDTTYTANNTTRTIYHTLDLVSQPCGYKITVYAYLSVTTKAPGNAVYIRITWGP